VSTELLETSGT